MTDRQVPNQMWGGRFAERPSEVMEAMNASVDFDQRLYRQDIEASRVHAAMLARTGIINENDAEAIDSGLITIISEIEAGDFHFSSRLEDIHMNVEARLAEIVGEPAGKLHTARSRNDQVATDFRLWIRAQADSAVARLGDLIDALLEQAEQGVDALMPGFTHLQSAQPVTWAHHMMAYVEMFSRDIGRFRDARIRMNESPLGAAALAGTSFPIDRAETARKLGFDRPMANSIDAVSDRDFALEYIAAAAVCATHMSRLAEEIVLWSTPQFGFVALGDRFSTGSSIMPQKRNPDAAELIRAKTGRINGSLIALLTVIKGLPLAYSKDLQEDKERSFDVADTLNISLDAMAGMLRDLSPNWERMRVAATGGHSTATDLADWLVRNLGVPFRQAHKITGHLVRLADERGCSLAELPIGDLQSVCGGITEDARSVMDSRRSVESRRSFGGTAPDRVRKQIDRWKELRKCEGA